MTDERHVLVIFHIQMTKLSHLLELLQVTLMQASQSHTLA